MSWIGKGKLVLKGLTIYLSIHLYGYTLLFVTALLFDNTANTSRLPMRLMGWDTDKGEGNPSSSFTPSHSKRQTHFLCILGFHSILLVHECKHQMSLASCTKYIPVCIQSSKTGIMGFLKKSYQMILDGVKNSLNVYLNNPGITIPEN